MKSEETKGNAENLRLAIVHFYIFFISAKLFFWMKRLIPVAVTQ